MSCPAWDSYIRHFPRSFKMSLEKQALLGLISEVDAGA